MLSIFSLWRLVSFFGESFGTSPCGGGFGFGKDTNAGKREGVDRGVLDF